MDDAVRAAETEPGAERRPADLRASGSSALDDLDASVEGGGSVRRVRAHAGVRPGRPIEVFLAALRLGLTSFGGPVAHIGYFRAEYVGRRRWLDDAAFGDLVALCQLLPGPASSELGIAIGTLRAGYAGGIAAWLGFTLPSAAALVAFAMLTRQGDVAGMAWVEGLKLAAVAVVAYAVLTMARSQTPDVRRGALAVAAAVAMLLAPTPALQVVVIGAGAALGWRFLRSGTADGRGPAVAARTAAAPPSEPTGVPASPGVPAGSGALAGPSLPVGRRAAFGLAATFVLLLAGLPVLVRLTQSHAVSIADAFYRSGALVFGGGHVVLPLLHSAVVPPGWIGNDRFLAGYGAAQAVPGPLFTFAAFLGAAMTPAPNGLPGAGIALVAIFIPGFLLIWAALPFWGRLRSSPAWSGVFAGASAAVVGILAAALYSPIATSSIHVPAEAFLAIAGFVLLLTRRVPPVAIVLLCAVAAQVFALP